MSSNDYTISAVGDVIVDSDITFKGDPTMGTGATVANWRSTLGVAIGSDVQAYHARLADIAGIDESNNNYFLHTDGSNIVAAAPSTARTNLGVAIGSDVQAYDAGLADIAGLAVTDGNIIVGDGTNWVAESGATARSSLGLAIGSDVQAYDAGLTDIAGLAVTDGNIIVGNGTNWVAESGATARTSLGLAIGSDVQAYSARLGDVAEPNATYGAGTDGYVLYWDNANSRVDLKAEGAYTAGTGLDLSGSEFAIDSTVATLTGSQTLSNKELSLPIIQNAVLLQDTGDSACGAQSGVDTHDSTDATPTDFLARNLSDDETRRVRVAVVARGDTTNYISVWTFDAVVHRNTGAASAALIGTTNAEQRNNAGASAWAAALSADTSGGGYKLTLTGAAGTNIKWCVKYDEEALAL